MAEIHNLEVPISKEPKRLWKTMNRWLLNSQKILENTKVNNNNGEFQREIETIKKIDFAQELEWLKNVIQNGNFPVVFCHNDMNEGNILLKDDVKPELVVIDYEFSSYNYRAFDLANHFLEWTFDYTNGSYPFYFCTKEQFPTTEQSQEFLSTYLKKLYELDCKDVAVSKTDIEALEKEVKVFVMVSHLYWSLWSISNAHQNIEFGYWDYAASRLKAYKERKESFLNGI